MFQLLLTMLLAEAALLLALFFNTDIRNPLIMALDCVKQGRGLAIVRTLEGTFLAVLMSSVYSILKIGRRSILAGSINSTDEVLLAEKMLQASLTGILLFLSMVIDKLHQLRREEFSLENIIKDEEKQVKEKKFLIARQLNALVNERAELKAKIKKLEFEHQMKTTKAIAAESALLALKKQCEGFHLEYNRLLDYNQTLQNQLQSIDQILLKDNPETRWNNLKSNIIPWGIKKPNNSRGAEVGSENEVAIANRCHQLFFSGSNPTSSPRHRRPIYQH